MLFSFGLLVSNCVRRLVRCPTCRSQEGWGRCKVLETLSSSLQSLGILPYTPTSPPSPLLVNTYIGKTKTHVHNYEHEQIPMVTDLRRRPVMGFLYLGVEAGGVYRWAIGQRLGYPHFATG